MNSGRESIISGTNAKMSEISACLILASLDQWGEERQNWLNLNKIATEISEKYGLNCHPALEKNFVTSYWIVNLKSKLIIDILERITSEAEKNNTFKKIKSR